MLTLRPLNDGDFSMIESWLNREHVKKWYEIPQLGISIDDWMNEIRAYKNEFRWIAYFIALNDKRPIGLCLCYKCIDSADEDFGTLPLAGTYGIDYLIGEEDALGKGLGRGIVALLVKRILALPDARRVTAQIDPNNTASAKTLLSCGFTLWEGKGDRYVYE